MAVVIAAAKTTPPRDADSHFPPQNRGFRLNALRSEKEVIAGIPKHNDKSNDYNYLPDRPDRTNLPQEFVGWSNRELAPNPTHIARLSEKRQEKVAWDALMWFVKEIASQPCYRHEYSLYISAICARKPRPTDTSSQCPVPCAAYRSLNSHYGRSIPKILEGRCRGRRVASGRLVV